MDNHSDEVICASCNNPFPRNTAPYLSDECEEICYPCAFGETREHLRRNLENSRRAGINPKSAGNPRIGGWQSADNDLAIR